MTGLLLKDGYTMLRQAKFFLVMIVILAFLPSDFVYGYAIFYAALLTTTTLTYDQRVKWDNLANMFPYTAGQIVGSKYLAGYLSVTIAVILSICGRYANALLDGRPATSMELATPLIIGCAATVMSAIYLPFAFWIGEEKGRLIFVLFTVVSIIGLMSIIETDALSMLNINLMLLLLAALGLTIAINFISFLAAIFLYKRRKV